MHAPLINVPEIWNALKMGFTRCLSSVKRVRTSRDKNTSWLYTSWLYNQEVFLSLDVSYIGLVLN